MCKHKHVFRIGYGIIDILTSSSFCQKLTNENADDGWLLLVKTELQCEMLMVLLGTAVTSDELSFVTSVSLIHTEIPLETSSIPLKRDSLLIWGISPCSSPGGEEQLVKSENSSTISTPKVLSGSDWLCSNSCWTWKESSQSPSVNRSGEHLWSKSNDEGRCWCWLRSAWTWWWFPLLADWADDEDTTDAEGWLVVFCWLLPPRWQPPIRASTCRRI